MEKQREIPAVTHVDGSGRLQSVYKNVAVRYHALISAFHAKTGIPILLNTSFNENEVSHYFLSRSNTSGHLHLEKYSWLCG